MDKQQKIPEMRFSEFDHVGTYDKHELQFYLSRITYGFTNPMPESDIGPFLITAKDIESGKINYDTCRHTTSEAYNELVTDKSRPNIGDILLTKDGALGRLAIVDSENCCINQSVALLQIKPNIDTSFLFWLLSSPKYQSIMLNNAGGSTIKHIYITIVDKMKIAVPQIPEQQKIASFFTAIDQKISQLKQKKTLLEQYKKGVMQNIFSQEIRFMDDNGQEFPMWENYRFNQVYSFRTTNSFSRDNLNYESGEVLNIHYGDIHTKFPTIMDITKEEVPYINSDISLARISKDNYCQNKDLLFADASEDVKDVGKCIELSNLTEEKVLSGLHTILARPDTDKVASGFGGYLMMSNDVRRQIMRISQGSKVTSISSTRLGDVELVMPCQREQLKIAKFLSAIDNKIHQANIQIDKAEIWKKGLLQKMFV